MLLVAIGVAALAIAAAAWLLGGGTTGSLRAWTRLGTADVHSLAFAPESTQHLYFGHHGGLLESRDGGRSWSALALRADAMGMSAGSDGSIVLAGHDVLIRGRAGGASFEPINADLPNLDIHAFARDPGDPSRMWAYLASGGLYESRDGGAHWERVFDGNRPFLQAVRIGGAVALLGIDPFEGLMRSDDAGRTWMLLSRPPAAPITSLAATPDARVLLLGSSQALLRSDDGGRTWHSIASPTIPLAIAVSSDGGSIALVTNTTEFYRSDDGGRTWPAP